MMNILLRSMELGSVQSTQVRRQEKGFYLRPPVAPFGRFAWDRVEELAEAGYRYGLEEIGRWKERGPLPGSVEG